MDVKIIQIVKKDLNNEVVWLKVLRDTDIGHYMIMDTTYINENKISNKHRHAYWFPDKPVKKGDFVALYTKLGRNTSFENKASMETHHFFWNMKSQVWNDTGDAAVLINTPQWETTKVP